jgi:hypothetical protein
MVSESDAPRGLAASPWPATAAGQPDGWFDHAAAYRTAQSAARDYAEQSFAEWSRWIGFAAQREADWFDEADRCFAAWYAWWQAAYGIHPGIAPLAGGLNAWWWSVQRTLPFAGVV